MLPSPLHAPKPRVLSVSLHLHSIILQILAVQSVARTNFASTTAAEEALGRELLTLLGRSANYANAFHLCVQLGLMKHHENLFAREAGVEKVGWGVWGL